MPYVKSIYRLLSPPPTHPPAHLISEQDGLLRLVSVDQAALRVVIGVVENGLKDLVHRRDACPAREHRQLRGVPRLALDEELPGFQVSDLSHGSLDVDGVADVQRVEKLRHLPAVREPVVGRVHLQRCIRRRDGEGGGSEYTF